MNILFLADQDLLNAVAAGGLTGGLVAFFMAFFLLMLIIAIAVYIYMSLAFATIAKKAKYRKTNLAWIPMLGPLIIANRIAKMPWWPMLLLLGVWIPFLGTLLSIAVYVFMIIWTWKMFEKIGRPGWWAIFWIISIVELVLLGVAAWGKK